MSHRRRLALAFAGAALFAAATPSLAYFRNVLASTIIGSMSPTELKSFTKAIGDVLRNTADNTPAQWTSAATGKQPAIDATITPLESKTDAGQSCRRLQERTRARQQQRAVDRVAVQTAKRGMEVAAAGAVRHRPPGGYGSSKSASADWCGIFLHRSGESAELAGPARCAAIGLTVHPTLNASPPS